jgi:hypothetical protein
VEEVAVVVSLSEEERNPENALWVRANCKMQMQYPLELLQYIVFHNFADVAPDGRYAGDGPNLWPSITKTLSF